LVLQANRHVLRHGGRVQVVRAVPDAQRLHRPPAHAAAAAAAIKQRHAAKQRNQRQKIDPAAARHNLGHVSWV